MKDSSCGLLLAFAFWGCSGSIDQARPTIASDFQFLRASTGELALGGRRYPNPSHYDAVELSIHRDASTDVRCRRDGSVQEGDGCRGLPFRTELTFSDGLLRCIAAWDSKGARLYEGCGLRPEIAPNLGCLATKATNGMPCSVCVAATGRVQSSSCGLANQGAPHIDCEVVHASGKMCVDCEDVQGETRRAHPPMCMDDNDNCPPETPDAGTRDGEGGGPPADAGISPDSGEGGGPAADAGASSDGGEGGGPPPARSLACQPRLPSTDIFCQEINVTFEKVGLQYGYGCSFAGTYLPPTLDAATRDAIDIWLAAHGGAVNPTAPPCEAMLAMATSWDCEEEHDDQRVGEEACAKRVGRQRLAGYARAQMIVDGACRP